jgi:RNA polymerase sigma-70 factor, ECF subfamily
VLRLALNLTRSEQDAQRIHQQVFLAAFAALPGYSQTTSLFIWIYRLAANYCIDHLRRQAPREGTAPLSVPARRRTTNFSRPVHQEPERVLVETEDSARLSRAIAQLSPRERLVLVLMHYHGLRAQTIAEILELPEAAIRDALNRAVVRVRMLLAG